MQSSGVILALKQILRTRGITYGELAEKLGLSQASVKRVFAEETFTLKRLEEICDVIGVSLSQLIRLAEGQSGATRDHFTREEEVALAEDPTLLILLYLLLDGATLPEIRAHYAITKKEEIRALRKLDDLKLIVLGADDNVRPLVNRLIKWEPNGPLLQKYRDSLCEEFFQNDFTNEDTLARLIPARLSSSSIARLKQKVALLLKEYNELAELDLDLPREKTTDFGLFVGYRAWRFSLFQEKRRE